MPKESNISKALIVADSTMEHLLRLYFDTAFPSIEIVMEGSYEAAESLLAEHDSSFDAVLALPVGNTSIEQRYADLAAFTTVARHLTNEAMIVAATDLDHLDRFKPSRRVELEQSRAEIRTSAMEIQLVDESLLDTLSVLLAEETQQDIEQESTAVKAAPAVA